MDIILTILALAGAFLFAVWYLRRTEERRAVDKEQRAEQEQRELSRAAGLPDGVRPLWDPADPDPIARKILDDGLAHNSKYVDDAFRNAYWSAMDSGVGMAESFRRAMDARKWRSGSQGQVFDRLYSHGKLDEPTRDRWKRSAEDRHPSGYGTHS